MNKTTSEIEPYIDRGYYNATLRNLRSEHPPEYYIGKRNPYTGTEISTIQEVDLYLQQQAMSLMYRRAASMALEKIREDFAQENTTLNNQVNYLLKENASASVEISSLKNQITTLKAKKRTPKIIAVVLAIALAFGAYYVPQMLQEQYDSGYASGKAHSTVINNYTYGSSGSSSSDTDGDSTMLDRILERRAAESGSSSTGSTTYKTTPISGYSLSRTVYVSNSGHKIHLRSNCSGMKYYTEMTYGEACERGYAHCSKCF